MPQGDELVQNTNAYYRSTYVLIYKKGGGLDGVETIEDPKLAGKRIGVVERTPPTANMAATKLMKNAKVYPLMVDTRLTPSMAEVMIKDMLAGEIDAAIIGGRWPATMPRNRAPTLPSSRCSRKRPARA